MATEIRVVLNGITGKVGSVIANNLREPDIKIVAGVSRRQKGLFTTSDGGKIRLYGSLEAALVENQARVVLDFTNAEACAEAFSVACEMHRNFVSGTSGLPDPFLQTMREAAESLQLGVAWIPNFSVGAVAMMFASEIMARFAETADVFEGHHELKKDAPSGTAIQTARRIAAVKPFHRYLAQKTIVPGVQGGEIDGVGIYSQRIPGLMADQTVVFGAQGQTFGVWHHAASRECYIPAVALVLREVLHLKGFVTGLEFFLGLSHASAFAVH